MKKINSLRFKQLFILLFTSVIGTVFQSCSGNSKTDSAVSPNEQEIAESYSKLGPVDDVLYEKGNEIFTSKCTACHNLDHKVVGPALRGITKRRTADGILNKIKSIREFIEADSTLKHIYDENKTEHKTLPPLTTDDERRALLEFFRKEGQTYNVN